MSKQAIATISYFSDVLCVWAYAAQIKLDELRRQFGDQLRVEYQFLRVFGDVSARIDSGWRDKGGAVGYARHLKQIAARFDHINIHLHNGKTFSIVCKNNSKDNKYIQSIQLNGRPLNQVWFTHSDLVNGGKLELQMGNTPNFELGTDPSTYPPSAMSVNPKKF